MSLSTRAIAGLGAVVVIAAGTLGGSIAYASGKDAPITTRATVTVGRNSHAFEPSCYNGGKPLDAAANTACGALSKNAAKFPVINVETADQIGVGVDTGTAKNGWQAFTNGGSSQGGTPVAKQQKNNTFSGLQPAVNILTSNSDTTLTVVETDPKSADPTNPGILAVWFITLRDHSLPPASPLSQDPSQGQAPAQGQDPSQQ